MSEAAIQLLFRAVNDQIMKMHAVFDVADPVVELLCECGNVTCTERLPLPREEYEGALAAGRFLVLPRHTAVATTANAG